MNPQDPLAALHPLREPLSIGWWPIAPGWWILIALLVLVAIVACWYLASHYRRNRYRRLASKQLLDIREQLTQATTEPNAQVEALSRVNALLKSVALIAFPRHDIASLSGEAWLNFLNESRNNTTPATQFHPDFAEAVYRESVSDLDIQLLFTASLYWIKQHRGPK